MRNLEETFGYDGQNRLIGMWLGVVCDYPTGVYAVVETRNGTNTVHYVLKDIITIE